MESEKRTHSNHDDLEMYFNQSVAEKFAEHEQNERNFLTADAVDQVIMEEIAHFNPPLRVAELGGGAHPDRYHRLFELLMKEPRGKIDWIDISPFMLDLAEKYLDSNEYSKRREIINYIEADIVAYLNGLPDASLDLAIMKYVLDHIQNLDELFPLMAAKLATPGRFVASLGPLNDQLKSYSTNARYLYNGQEFPDNETRTLKDGDSYRIKFFKESGNPAGGYIEGAETVKYYHSPEIIRELAAKNDLEIFLGDWKELVKQDENGIELPVLILRK